MTDKIVYQPYSDASFWRALRFALIKVLAGRSVIVINAQLHVVDEARRVLMRVKDCPLGAFLSNNRFEDLGATKIFQISSAVESR